MPQLHAGAVMPLVLALVGCWGPAAEQEPVDLAASDLVDRGDLVLTTWNLEFFGSPTAGPRDDGLQVANAATVIRRLEPDVLGLQEIVDPHRFEELERALPAYQAISAEDPRVSGGAAAYPLTMTRPALLVKREGVHVRSVKVVDGVDALRPPLEVALTLEREGLRLDLVVLVVHFFPFAEPASWYHRRDSGDALKRYLDAAHRGDAVAVIGDFNDDIDASTLPGWGTPYAQLRDDARYRFTTDGLSRARQGTTVDWPSTIDHHLVTQELAARFVAGSAWIERPTYVSDYRRTTSDHYPVTTRYRLR